MKIELVPNWKRAWKFASVQLPVLGLILMSISDVVQQAWQQLPQQVQQNMPHSSTIAMGVFALSILGRILVFTQKEPVNADS
jgi:hypothetical protein